MRRYRRAVKSPGRRPKKSLPAKDTSAAILAAARSIFAMRGYVGTSTREVAETAEVNNAMIYYHFRDKRGLYRAVLTHSFNEFARIWEDPIFSSDAPVQKKLQTYVAGLIEFHHANEDLRRILSMEFACDGENSKWVADHFFKGWYDKLSAIIRQGIRNKEIKSVDPSVAITSLTGMITHSFVLGPLAKYVVGRNLDLSMDTFGSFVLDTFFKGLNLQGHPLRCRKQGVS